jgi:transketolase
MRNAFIAELCEQAEKNDRIALVVGDLGYGVIEPFAKKFPERFFNAGVAEQNMMGLCAGLASEGYHVFAYSIANFPTFRCAEQIRNDIAYHQLPVTVVSVGGGVSYGNLGYSHHAVQDYALIRTMPHMLIAAPGDPMEVKACVRYLLRNPQPSYLRLGKAGEKNLHEKPPSLTPGKWVKVRSGTASRKAVVCTGTALADAFSWSKPGAVMNTWDLYSLPLWSMSCKDEQGEQIEAYDHVVTVEDHLIDAGFGSWMLESLAGAPALRQRLEILGFTAQVTETVASQHELHRMAGLQVLPESLLEM